MLLLSSIITEKNRKKNFGQMQCLYNNKKENRIEELKQNIIIDYYLNGGY